MSSPSSSEVQALADGTLVYQINRLTIGDREYEGPGITAVLPSKNRPFWTFKIWGQHTVLCAYTPVMMEVSEIHVEPEEEIPEEE